MRRKGFTLIELLVVIAIIALLVSILLPSLTRARELAKQAICGTRLKGIGTAMATYQNDYKIYPAMATKEDDGSVTYPSSVESDPSKHSGTDKKEALNTFWDNETGCNIQALYLLVHHNFCGANLFECPSDADYIEPEIGSKEAGFDSWYNVSYAFQPFTHYSDDSGGGNAGYPGKTGQDGSVVIGGDKQTGKEEWTINHDEYGGNFLSINQSVAFHKNEFNLVGWNKNMVFIKDVDDDGELTWSKDPDEVESLDDISGGSGLPDHMNDSVLIWSED